VHCVQQENKLGTRQVGLSCHQPAVAMGVRCWCRPYGPQDFKAAQLGFCQADWQTDAPFARGLVAAVMQPSLMLSDPQQGAAWTSP